MQTLLGSLPRAPTTSSSPNWGARAIPPIRGGPPGIRPPRHGKRPAALVLLPHLKQQFPDFARVTGPRVTTWDRGFDRQETLPPTLNTRFPNPNEPPKRLDLAQLRIDPNELLSWIPAERPIPWGDLEEAENRRERGDRLPIEERKRVALRWLRSIGCGPENKPSIFEFTVAGLLAGVSLRTVQRYWEKRGSPHKKTGCVPYAARKATHDLQELLDMIASAKDYSYASYFIFTSILVALALIERVLEGLQVLLYTDGTEAKGGNSNNEILELLESHDIFVKVRPSSSLMHEKFLIIDGVKMSLGSSNATESGMGTMERPRPRNQEANVLLEDKSCTETFRLKFIAEFENGVALANYEPPHKKRRTGSS